MPSLFSAGSWRKALAWSAAGIGVFAALAVWGMIRVPSVPVANVPGTVIRLVQPKVSQSEKSSSEMARARFDTLLELSTQPSPNGLHPNVIIWPETSVPYPFDMYPEVTKIVGSILPPNGFVLAGVVSMSGKGADRHFYNSLDIVDPHGDRMGHYDKVHLAPFGEYMPFRSILHLDALAVGAVDLTPGDGPKTLEAPGLPPFSPLICYEAIFPERLIQPGTHPRWLLQVTNDGWFGTSSGPYQHFAMARARAVEQGLPLMRAGNTGITAAIDPYGRILAILPIATKGTLDIPLPSPLSEPPLYASYGDTLFLVLILLTFVIFRVNLQKIYDFSFPCMQQYARQGKTRGNLWKR